MTPLAQTFLWSIAVGVVCVAAGRWAERAATLRERQRYNDLLADYGREHAHRLKLEKANRFLKEIIATRRESKP